MFSSLAQTLGLNETFFIQLVLFLLIYSVISKLLLSPYIKLHDRRNQETVLKKEKAKKLKAKTKQLQIIYEKKVQLINKKFNTQYKQEQQKRQKELLAKKEFLQNNIKKQHSQNLEQLKQEIKQAREELHIQEEDLTESMLNTLFKGSGS